MNSEVTHGQLISILSQDSFHFDSPYWSDKNVTNLLDGENGFDGNETKLPTYWNTPFSKICLGMRIGQKINFIGIDKEANSLYSLISDGQYRATSLGRDTWKSLIGSQATLQTACSREGFNCGCSVEAASKARIGIVANNQQKCDTCDSKVGFGTGGYTDGNNTCGNVGPYTSGNGHKNFKAMGYILVQWKELSLIYILFLNDMIIHTGCIQVQLHLWFK